MLVRMFVEWFNDFNEMATSIIDTKKSIRPHCFNFIIKEIFSNNLKMERHIKV